MSEPVDRRQILTFVVRLWREADASSRGRWCGRVEHIPSQEVRYVEDIAAVVRFMERWTDEPDAAQGSTTS